MDNDSTLPPEAPTTPLEQDVSLGISTIGTDAYGAVGAGMLLAGRYQLIELIGQGGIGRVFRALDRSLSVVGAQPAVLALKVLPQDFTMAGRFSPLAAHVRRLQQLNHPNIVRLHGCDRHGSIAFITMEYLQGQSLYAMLHREGAAPTPLDGQESRHLISAVADAIEYSHAHGVVHGDLKPGNVMVTGDQCKVIDFGMTRWRAPVRVAATDEVVKAAATPRYASPQLLASHEPHPSDDVFSLACIAYEILTGVHPFEGKSGSEAHASTPPQRSGLTAGEYAALVHALKGTREQRTSTIREFLTEFAAAPRRTSKTLWTMSLIAAAAIVAVIYVVMYRPTATPPAAPSAPLAPPAPATTAAAQAAPIASAAAPSSATAPALIAGTIIQDCPTCLPMAVVAAGAFEQGANPGDPDALPAERPAHQVRLEHAFAASLTDITVDSFRRFVEATGRNMQGCETYDGQWRHHATASWRNPGFTQTPQHPAVCISWNDAVAYADWVSAEIGHKYRLPSASEWEYIAKEGGLLQPWQSDQAGACRHADVADRSAERRFPGWNAFPCDDGFVYTAPVGSFKANSLGMSDVFGNVMVWTQDCWKADYQDAPRDGSARTTPACAEHELRGGSWFSPPAVVRASNRSHFASDYRTSSVGFRLVREMD